MFGAVKGERADGVARRRGAVEGRDAGISMAVRLCLSVGVRGGGDPPSDISWCWS